MIQSHSIFLLQNALLYFPTLDKRCLSQLQVNIAIIQCILQFMDIAYSFKLCCFSLHGLTKFK